VQVLKQNCVKIEMKFRFANKLIMNCREIQNKLIFFIEGDLNSNDSSYISGHIENCKDCQFLFNQLKSSLEFIENDKQTETNPFFFTRVMAGIEAKPKENIIINWLRKKQYSMQLSGYALIIVAAIAIGHYLGKDKMSTEIEQASQEIEISDNQLFAETYQFNLNEADIYIIKADVNEE